MPEEASVCAVPLHAALRYGDDHDSEPPPHDLLPKKEAKAWRISAIAIPPAPDAQQEPSASSAVQGGPHPLSVETLVQSPHQIKRLPGRGETAAMQGSLRTVDQLCP